MQVKKILTSAVNIGIILAAGCIFTGCSRQAMPTLRQEETYLVEEYEDQVLAETAEAAKGAPCYVYICGAVNRPGVYEMQPGERIFRVVELAGGFTEDASETSVNQAMPVEDGLSIVVPTKEEAAAAAGLESTLVNINTAKEAELCSLPGIGQTRAAAIIAYREEKGAFKDKEDLMLVSGIGPSSFDKLKDLIRIS